MTGTNPVEAPLAAQRVVFLHKFAKIFAELFGANDLRLAHLEYLVAVHQAAD
jgi:hypothetical protein